MSRIFFVYTYNLSCVRGAPATSHSSAAAAVPVIRHVCRMGVGLARSIVLNGNPFHTWMGLAKRGSPLLPSYVLEKGPCSLSGLIAILTGKKHLSRPRVGSRRFVARREGGRAGGVDSLTLTHCTNF